jgi:anti-anti-sigma regulatory factor
MASNFKLISYQKSDSLHLKLHGDFDGNSAFELINALSENKTGLHKALIDTSGLTIIYSFGREVYEKKIRIIKRQYHNLIFVGKYKHYFAT